MKLDWASTREEVILTQVYTTTAAFFDPTTQPALHQKLIDLPLALGTVPFEQLSVIVLEPDYLPYRQEKQM